MWPVLQRSILTRHCKLNACNSLLLCRKFVATEQSTAIQSRFIQNAATAISAINYRCVVKKKWSTSEALPYGSTPHEDDEFLLRIYDRQMSGARLNGYFPLAKHHHNT